MVFDSEIVEEARMLYDQCDLHKRGHITREDLNPLKASLSLDDEQLDAIFCLLDENNQGMLTFESFLHGFGQFLTQKNELCGSAPDQPDQSDSDDELLMHQSISAAGAQRMFESYKQIANIWKPLRRENPSLLPEFEKLLTAISTELDVANTEHRNMDSIIQSKLAKQEEHLNRLVEELEQQLNQEKERLVREEQIKEKQLREELFKELQEKERLTSELNLQYEQVRGQVEELEQIHLTTMQEKERLLQEKEETQRRLDSTQQALDDCRDYIEMLKKKARDDKKSRAKAAIELSENIALERENLVRQLDTLRSINRKLLDEREERRQLHLSPSESNDQRQPLKSDVIENSLLIRSGCTESTNNADESECNPTCASEVIAPESTAELRRGSVMSAYFATIKQLSADTTELDSITEVDEDEALSDVFNSGGDNWTSEHSYSNGYRKSFSRSNKHSLDGSESIRQFRVYKVTVIGDTAVGKSCIVKRLVYGTYEPDTQVTISIDYCSKIIDCDGEKSILQLWDTAGQERFRGITRQFYRRADAVVIVFDLTMESTFLAVRYWIDEVRRNAEDETIILILANKYDKIDSTEDPSGQNIMNMFSKLAEEYKVIGFEVSALNAHNIDHAFKELAKLLRKKEEVLINNALKLESHVAPKKKKCCF